MDFEIGNLLYIVITLVAVIVGVLGKKKKPANGGSGTTESAARPGFLENLERVLQMGQEQPEIKDLQEFETDLPDEEVLTVEESHADLRNRPSIMDEYDRIMNGSNEGEFGSMIAESGLTDEALEVFDLDGTQGNNYFEIVRDFDAGTAVVYSTIINRLDY